MDTNNSDTYSIDTDEQIVQEKKNGMRILEIVAPEYSENVKEVENLIKNTYRKYKLRNYGMLIKFKIDDTFKDEKILIKDEGKEIESYDHIDVETLDKVIEDVKEAFKCKTIVEGGKKKIKSFKDRYLSELTDEQKYESLKLT